MTSSQIICHLRSTLRIVVPDQAANSSLNPYACNVVLCPPQTESSRCGIFMWIIFFEPFQFINKERVSYIYSLFYLSQIGRLSFIERFLFLILPCFLDGFYFSSFVYRSHSTLGLRYTFLWYTHLDVMAIWVIFAWIDQWCHTTLLPENSCLEIGCRVLECWQWADGRSKIRIGSRDLTPLPALYLTIGGDVHPKLHRDT
jgi:hypothetical protein